MTSRKFGPPSDPRPNPGGAVVAPVVVVEQIPTPGNNNANQTAVQVGLDPVVGQNNPGQFDQSALNAGQVLNNETTGTLIIENRYLEVLDDSRR